MKRKNMLIERLQEENKKLKQENDALKRQLASALGYNPDGRLAKIKRVKEETGCSLQEAINAVNNFEDIDIAIKRLRKNAMTKKIKGEI